MDRIEFESVRPEEPAPVPYFWLMTIQLKTHSSMRLSTRTGSLYVGPTMTYTQAYIEVLDMMRRDAAISENESVVVLAWVLEPDALGGAR
ncbi:hypothetical protein ABZ605_37945 [Streptomyces sp. NPDC012765]|uniref:hypothetical protein n=1 Tax=Streptomyces sp. NPDC012765 TaxID=3155249 RepID=UPI0033C66AC9